MFFNNSTIQRIIDHIPDFYHYFVHYEFKIFDVSDYPNKERKLIRELILYPQIGKATEGAYTILNIIKFIPSISSYFNQDQDLFKFVTSVRNRITITEKIRDQIRLFMIPRALYIYHCILKMHTRGDYAYDPNNPKVRFHNRMIISINYISRMIDLDRFQQKNAKSKQQQRVNNQQNDQANNQNKNEWNTNANSNMRTNINPSNNNWNSNNNNMATNRGMSISSRTSQSMNKQENERPNSNNSQIRPAVNNNRFGNDPFARMHNDDVTTSGNLNDTIDTSMNMNDGASMNCWPRKNQNDRKTDRNVGF